MSGYGRCSAPRRPAARSSSGTRRRPPASATPSRTACGTPRTCTPPAVRWPHVEQAGGFEESHSHATSHLLLPEDRDLLASGGTGADASVLVLVDDEFSTGNTVLNTIRALHALHPRERYVIVALVDMRSAA